MMKTRENEIMPSTDVDYNNDYATESVGIDADNGLWVIGADGEQISFSTEVQESIMFGLAEKFGYTVE